MDGLLLGILSGLLRQTLFFLPGLMPDHALRYLSGHGHDDHGSDDSDRDHGQTDRFVDRPGVQQAYGGGNEHDRHDLDQEIGGGAYLLRFQDARAQGGEHKDQPVDACGNGQRYQDMQDLTEKRNDQDDAELA